MIPVISYRGWYRSRRTVPPPEPFSGYPVEIVTQHGSTAPQAPGRSPSWPRNWQRSHPLDPVVFGSEPRVRGEL